MTERLDDLGHHPVYLRRSRDVGELNPYRTVRIGMLIAERRQLYFVTANSANRRASLRAAISATYVGGQIDDRQSRRRRCEDQRA